MNFLGHRKENLTLPALSLLTHSVHTKSGYQAAVTLTVRLWCHVESMSPTGKRSCLALLRPPWTVIFPVLCIDVSKCIAGLSSKAVLKVNLVVMLRISTGKRMVVQKGEGHQLFFWFTGLFCTSWWEVTRSSAVLGSFSRDCLWAEWGRWAQGRKERERKFRVCVALNHSMFSPAPMRCVFSDTGGFIALLMPRDTGGS